MNAPVAWRLACPAHGPRLATAETRLESRFASIVRATCGRAEEVTDRDLHEAGAPVQLA